MKNVIKVLFVVFLMLTAALFIKAGDIIFESGSLNITESLSVDIDTLYVDSGSGNVGIGTVSPGSKLDVDGGIRAQQICDENGANCNDISSGWDADTLDSEPESSFAKNTRGDCHDVQLFYEGVSDWYMCESDEYVAGIYYQQYALGVHYMRCCDRR